MGADMWLAPGKCMYRYPGADDESNGAFSLLSGRWAHGCGISEAESVISRGNATNIGRVCVKMCLYSGKLVCA